MNLRFRWIPRTGRCSGHDINAFCVDSADSLGAVPATAEYAGIPAKEFLAALAVAYQVQCRLSDAAPDRAPLDSGVKAVKNLEKISVRNLAMHLV